MTYLLWLIYFVWIPTSVIWLFQYKLLWKYKKTLLFAMTAALIFSIPWDLLAVKTNIWYFPQGHNLGLFIFSLPLEELLFMTTVTLLAGSVAIISKYTLDKKTKL